jgi:hypothetical protein
VFPVPAELELEVTEDKAVGTPNVEVVALLAACSVKFKSTSLTSFFLLKRHYYVHNILFIF